MSSLTNASRSIQKGPPRLVAKCFFFFSFFTCLQICPFRRKWDTNLKQRGENHDQSWKKKTSHMITKPNRHDQRLLFRDGGNDGSEMARHEPGAKWLCFPFSLKSTEIINIIFLKGVALVVVEKFWNSSSQIDRSAVKMKIFSINHQSWWIIF